MKRCSLILCAAIAAAALPSSLQADAIPPPADAGPVVIARSQLRKFHSAIVGQDFLLKIQLPDGYEAGTRRYPVLLLLDGDYHFGTATDMAQMLMYGGHVPPLIIVSPTYGSTRAPQEGGSNMRMRDFAVTAERGNAPAGADAFLDFLKRELLPYVDASFRTDPNDRTLWGYSLGARFVLAALFREPGLFQRYIAVDGFHDSVLALENAYAASGRPLPGTVFLCARPSDARMKSFADLLQGRRYPGLRVRYAELSDPAHFVVPAEGLSRGLKTVFEDDASLPKPVVLPAVAEVLLPIAETSGAAAALAKYEELKRAKPNAYRFDLIPLTRALLARERLDAALQIAQYQAEHDPARPAPHVVLGDVHRKLGQRALAIESYRKALEISPNSKSAQRALQEIEGAAPEKP